LLIGALLWGGIVATFLSGRINDQWFEIVQKLLGAGVAREWGAALIAPGVEELVKFLGVVVLYLIARSEFDDVLDGFVYGALVGLGFTLSEDMYYFFTHFVGQAGATDLGGLFEGFFMRIIVGGPYSHVLLTGLTGMGLAYYVTRPDVARQRRLLVALGLYAAGVAAHFVWNSPLFESILGDSPDEAAWIAWAAVKGLPFLVLLAVLVRDAMRRERRWVRETLADDVAAGLVTQSELDDLSGLRRRRESRHAIAARKGPAGERLLARLQHAQIALALSESSTAPDRATRLAADRELIRSLRGQLDAVPDFPASGAPPPAPPAAFAPTQRVPIEGLPAWPIPDGSGPATPLAGGLELEIVQRVADWAQVRASNGWTGWVDGRRLLPMTPPTP
jgi:RsiW-degrading membrane proteinase PrsW (M82 family)